MIKFLVIFFFILTTSSFSEIKKISIVGNTRVNSNTIESLVDKKSPRQILDDLYNKRHRYSTTHSIRNIQRLGGWAGFGGIGFMCFEVFC